MNSQMNVTIILKDPKSNESKTINVIINLEDKSSDNLRTPHSPNKIDNNNINLNYTRNVNTTSCASTSSSNKPVVHGVTADEVRNALRITNSFFLAENCSPIYSEGSNCFGGTGGYSSTYFAPSFSYGNGGHTNGHFDSAMIGPE